MRRARRVWRSAALVAGVAGVVVACQSLAGISDLVIGDCKGGACPDDGSTPDGVGPGDGAVQPAVDSGSPCIGKLPNAVRVGSPGNTFCVDSTEVSVADYQAFLEAKIPASTQPGVCVWNTSFEPALPAPVDGGPPPPAGNEPVGYVNWCDALAYCTWAGKYLCGTVDGGKKIGPVTIAGMADYRSHQWLLACSAEARLTYPYGPLFDPSKCNFADYEAGTALPVGSLPGCVGGYAGIHDMLGNVWEWYDSPCRTAQLEVDGGDGGPQSDGCDLRGGSYGDQGTTIDCRTNITVRRDMVLPNVGFRCCSD